MGFVTGSLGPGLPSLTLNSCSMLECYSISVWHVQTYIYTHTHPLSSSRADVMSVSSYVKLPSSISGLSGEHVEKTKL